MNTKQVLSNLIPTILALGAAATAAACGDDKDARTNENLTDAGTGGRSTGGRGSGGTPTGGRSGSGGTPMTGGATATGGTPAAGGTSGVEAGTDAEPDSGPIENRCPESPADAGVDAGTPSGVVLVATTDYSSTTEVAAVDLATGQVLGRTTFADGDAIPKASGGRGFVLERRSGAVDVLSATGTVQRRIDLGPSDGAVAKLNPHDIVLVPGEASSKAYVSLFDGNALAIVDVEAGTVTGTVSLASLVDPADTDGSVDVDAGFYDAGTRRAYFVAGRVDLNTAMVAPYELACPGVPSVLIAVDVATDTLVDLNGTGPGVALPLGLVSPADVVFDESAGSVTLLHSGCFVREDGGSRRANHGIESVNLATGVTTVLLSPTSGDFLNQMLPVAGGAALVESFDANFAQSFTRWTRTDGLTCTYAGIPDGATVENANVLLGVVQGSGTDGGSVWQVVRHDLASGQNGEASDSWANALTAVGGVVVVR